MNLSKFLSFEGRVSRLNFWFSPYLLWLPLALLGGVTALVSISPIPLLAMVPAALLVGGLCAYAWCGLAVSVKRLHDTGRSGMWLIKYYAVYAVLATPVLVFNLLHRPPASSVPSFGWAAVLLVCSFALLAQLGYFLWIVGFKHGDLGANGHGEPDSGSPFVV